MSTGDANQFFLGSYEQLADAYLNPTSLYRNLDLANFTGREATIGAIDGFMQQHDRGYVEIEGGLGVGKTTLLAHLATQRGYAHHFVQLMPNKGDIGVAMRNLCAQLIRAWDLHAWAPGGALTMSASRPDTFMEILDAACQRRNEFRPATPIVIVVDGLDEAGQPQAVNPLGLPRQLFPGVYMLVAHRDVYVPLAVNPPKLPLVLNMEESRQDIERFLRAAAKRPAIARILYEEGPAAEDTFVSKMLEKTSGLWLYVSYVLVEIETGSRSPADLDRLPGGLWQYYEQFWRTWQRDHPDEWVNIHQPLLSTISAARESLSAEFLAELAGIPDARNVEALLDDPWKPFLDVDDTRKEVRYGISQASFRAFLEGHVDVGLLNQAEQRTVRRSAEATCTTHGRIADRYLEAWGGIARGLPALQDEAAANMDGGYGLRHLAEHLMGGGRTDELHRLLWTGWESTQAPSEAPAGRVVNAWRQAHERAGMLAVYLNDVANAWRLVTAACEPLINSGVTSPNVSLELRYALLSASVSSMAANVPPALLVALCNTERISTAEALAYARRGPDPLSRVQALLAMSQLLEPALRAEVLREVLVSCRAVEDEQLRTGALALLAPDLPVEWREEARDVANSITDEFWHVGALRVVDELLGAGAGATDDMPGIDPGDQGWHDRTLALDHAVAVSRLLRSRHDEALARLTARLPEQPEGKELDDALTKARLIPQDRWRAEALTAIAERIPDGPARIEVLDQALASARAVGDSTQHAQALAALARQLCAAGRHAEAVATARAIKDAYRRTATLADLVDELPTHLREDAVTEAGRGLAGVGDIAQRARVLSRHPALVAALAEGNNILAEARRAVPDEHWRALVLTALLPTLDGPVAEQALIEAFDIASRLDPGHGRAHALVRLAPLLSSPLVDKALALVKAVAEPDERAMAMGPLCVRLVDLGRHDEALAEAALIDDGFGLAEAQAHLAEALARTGPGDVVLAAARAIPYPHWRATALARLAARHPDAVLQEAFEAATASGSDAGVAEALLLVASSAPAPSASRVIGEALSVARRVTEAQDRARVLARVVSTLASTGRVQDALDLVPEIDDEHWQADAVRAAASHMNDPATVERALHLANGLDDGLERASTIAALLCAPAEVAMPKLYQAWRTVLRLLGNETRRDLLVALPDLLPALERLGGADALVDARDTVESVRRWWP